MGRQPFWDTGARGVSISKGRKSKKFVDALLSLIAIRSTLFWRIGEASQPRTSSGIYRWAQLSKRCWWTSRRMLSKETDDRLFRRTSTKSAVDELNLKQRRYDTHCVPARCSRRHSRMSQKDRTPCRCRPCIVECEVRAEQEDELAANNASTTRHAESELSRSLPTVRRRSFTSSNPSSSSFPPWRPTRTHGYLAWMKR